MAATPRGYSKAADEWWGKCRQVQVLDQHMSYYDSDPQQSKSDHAVVFLHGNPTSSFIWRNVVPHVEPIARCLAPDFIGHGRSDKRQNHSYRVEDLNKYLSAWFDTINLPAKVSVVGHDWGAVLGLYWSHVHSDRVEAVIHMESIPRPLNRDWDLFPEEARPVFQNLRGPQGDQLQLEQNIFVEKLIPLKIMRKLSEDEMNAYREPFKNPGEDRRPPLTTVRQIPIEGDGPEDVIEIANAYYKWFRETKIPKLYIDCEPGLFSPELRKMAEEKLFPNQEVAVVKGLHFMQEDSPDDIGREICQFLSKVFSGDKKE